MHGGRLRQAADLSFQPGGTIRRAAIQASPSSSSIPTARTPSRTRGGPSPTLISRSRWRTERPIRSANCLFVRIFCVTWRPRSLRVAQSYAEERRQVV
jgi:hypothetical protein